MSPVSSRTIMISSPATTSGFRLAAAASSGSMPSPGNTAILFVMSVVPIKIRCVVLRSGKQPRRRDAAALFIRLDLVSVLQGETDVVEAVEQFIFAELIDVELECITARCDDALGRKIDRELVTRRSKRFREQLIQRRRLQHDGQDAVIETVVEKDIGVAGRDDDAETIIEQRPRRVLARGTAAEVVAREQDLRALITRLIQHEIGVHAPLAVIHAGLTRIEIA